MKRVYCIGLFIGVVAVLLPLQAEALVVTYTFQPTAANYKQSTDCPAGDGSSHLDPYPITVIAAPTQALRDALGATAPAPASGPFYPGWTFNYNGGALHGTLWVDEYRSVFPGTHYSGANLYARYKKGEGDPANLQFIQLVSETPPFKDAPNPHIDPWPQPRTQDQLSKLTPAQLLALWNARIAYNTTNGPFYLTQAEMPLRQDGAYNWGGYGKDYDREFNDRPRKNHPNSTATWKAELYLANLDATNHVLTVYEGIQWGFQGTCATTPVGGPEPETLMLIAPALLAFAGIAYRRIHRAA